MSKLTVNVKIIAGTHLRTACEEMLLLRQKLGINIAAKFNGIEIFVCRDDQTIDALEKEFEAEIKLR